MLKRCCTAAVLYAAFFLCRTQVGKEMKQIIEYNSIGATDLFIYVYIYINVTTTVSLWFVTAINLRERRRGILVCTKLYCLKLIVNDNRTNQLTFLILISLYSTIIVHMIVCLRANALK